MPGNNIAPYLYVLVPLIALALGYKLVLRVFGVVIIPEDSIGEVTKKFVLFGANRSLPDGALVALNGEAGLQADTLPPGIHYLLWPWQYEITIRQFMTIQPNMVGVVEARDGKPLSNGRILCRTVECDCFQDARKFLEGGGERGPQLAIIPPGTYRINQQLFAIRPEPVQDIADNMVGVITTKEGRPLCKDDIAGPVVDGHNSFQNPQIFLDNGGCKGMQEQVILAGRYFINPLFATVDPKPMTMVPIAHAGVVISYVGATGEDVTGKDFQHGNMVAKGCKGVLVEPLDPGKYPVNPATHKVENVPTANIVLNWATGKSESHNLDANLSTITVRSSDGYTFNLDVSQIIHIPRTDAPKVIARFGNVSNLVTQVLEPTIGNYFRNAAQGSDVIEFLAKRKERQEDAKVKIAAALKEYNVVAVDTLIGDIVPPAELMQTLKDRKLAEQQKITYDTQKLAEETKKDFEQAKALAATQARVVDSERNVTIAEFTAKAAIETAKGEAQSKTINAKADAEVLTMVGKAEGEKLAAVGGAEARVIELKTAAVGPNNYANIEIASALAKSGFKLVPDVVAGGGERGGSMVDVIMANMVYDNLKKNNDTAHPATPKEKTVAAPVAAPVVPPAVGPTAADKGKPSRQRDREPAAKGPAEPEDQEK